MRKYALCSPFLPIEIQSEIAKLSSSPCVAVPPSASLPTPVSHHPDMLFFNRRNSTEIVTSKAYYAVNRRFFDDLGSTHILLDDTVLGSEYPNDIAFDAIGINGTLYCLEAHTASSVKAQFSRTVNIKQGYAACSTLILSDRAAVTADSGIAKALKADGIEVLTVSPSGIALPGYGCGFIGGASAVINSTAVFFGSLKNHPDAERIAEFCRRFDITVLDFEHLPLTDYGSIRYIYQ